MDAPSGSLLVICATILLVVIALRRSIAAGLEALAAPGAIEAVEARLDGLEERWKTLVESLTERAEAIEAEAARARKDREAATMANARASRLLQQRAEMEKRAAERGDGDEDAEADEQWIARTMEGMRGGSGRNTQ